MEAYKGKGGNGTKKKRWKLKLNHLLPWSIHCWPGGLEWASLRKCWDNVCNFKHFQAWLIICCGFKAPNSCKSRAWGTRPVSHVGTRTSQPAVTSLLACSLPPATLLGHAWSKGGSPGCYSPCKGMEETVSDLLGCKMGNDHEASGFW